MQLRQHIESKTNGPFLLLLVVVVGLALCGRLTAEVVEAIKYLGGSLFAVRAVANATENLKGKNADN